MNMMSGVSLAASDHSLVIDGGSVWGFGLSNSYQLGDLTSSKYIRQPCKFPDLPAIKSVACNLSTSLFLDCEGQVYICGRVFVDRINGISNNLDFQKPTLIPGLPPIVQMVADHYYLLFLAEDGSVWGCGCNFQRETNTLVPKQLENIPPMKKIAEVSRNPFLLDEQGAVWMTNTPFLQYLQPAVKHPQEISCTKVPNIPPITDICGRESSAIFLDQDGVTWNHQPLSCVRKSFPNPITAISQGRYHSLYLDTAGTVWGFGGVRDAQFGVEDQCVIPKKIKGLREIKEMCAGLNHSLFVDYENCVWAVGRNNNGQLGLPQSGYLFAKKRYNSVIEKIPEVKCRNEFDLPKHKSARNV